MDALEISHIIEESYNIIDREDITTAKIEGEWLFIDTCQGYSARLKFAYENEKQGYTFTYIVWFYPNSHTFSVVNEDYGHYEIKDIITIKNQ